MKHNVWNMCRFSFFTGHTYNSFVQIVTMGTASSDTSESDNGAAIDEMDGIIPRAVADLFAAIARDEANTIPVEMSFLEI